DGRPPNDRRPVSSCGVLIGTDGIQSKPRLTPPLSDNVASERYRVFLAPLMAALISRVGLLLGPVQELHVLGHDLGNPARAAVLGLIRAGLQAAFHGHQ